MPSTSRLRRPFLIACCLAALAAPAALTQPALAQAQSATPTQLPDVARPTHYAISLTPDAANLAFTGHVAIDVTILKPTATLTLNAADLAISGAGIVGGEPAQVTVDAATETVTLTFAAPLKPGKTKIELSYAGKINQQANGLFALDYKDIDGKDARSIFTQFEPADARRVFPGWDEPSYKATFDFTATVPANRMAIGNMPVASRKPAGNGLDTVTFETSPRMSTYLVFFALGDLERIAMKSGKTEIGIVTSRGQSKQAQFALESEAKLVRYFNDYFATPYPLPKLDTVAGPGRSQFFGAMENWGAIFTFEYALLHDPKLTTPSQYQSIFSVGAHETAHQWFGDLVTMKWWNDIWLNEGFASWMESKATAHFFPEWEPALSRVTGREGAMTLDARVTTHPVVQTIETVDQMNQAFDAISYNKGEAVIAMLESFAGADTWRKGLRLYMKRHAYWNTATSDLWGAIETAGAKGLSTVAQDFITQPGIPLIRVTDAICTGGTTRLTLAQGQFSTDRKSETDASPLRWHIPVAAITAAGKTARTMVKDGAGTLSLPGCGAALLNTGQAGYYRTLYTPAQLTALNADFGKFAALDQFGLMADQMALAKAGYQPMSAAIDLLAHVGAASSTRLQAEGLKSWGDLYGLVKDDPAAQQAIATRVSAAFGPALTRLGFAAKPGEPLLDTALRGQLITTLGQMGDARVLAEARRLFAALDTDPAALEGPLQQTWLAAVAINASEADWQKLRAMANKATAQLERSAYFQLLARARDAALARKTLELALTDEPGRTVSAALVSGVATQHPDLTIDFALERIDAVENLVDSSGRPRYIARLGAESRDPAMIGKLRAYAEKRLPESSRSSIEQSINLLESRAKLEPAIRTGIKEWLAR